MCTAKKRTACAKFVSSGLIMNVLELMITCLTLSAKFVIDVLYRFYQLDAVGMITVCLVIGFCYTKLLICFYRSHQLGSFSQQHVAVVLFYFCLSYCFDGTGALVKQNMTFLSSLLNIIFALFVFCSE